MIESTRLHEIHADPSCATPAEIQGLAETYREFQRTRGQKNLRDEFAMAALTVAAEWFGHKPENAAKMAAQAYKLADAMLKERV